MNRATSATGWVKNPDGTPGYTWNPITGCLNHTGGLCKGGGFPCYAYRLANGRLKSRYLANENIPKPSYAEMSAYHKFLNDPFYPRFWEERVEAPVHNFRFHRWAERQRYRDRGIFVCDMGELFGDWIPREWQDRVFETIKSCPNDRFYLLTKQPQNLIKFSPFPDNCWVGVTATSRRFLIDSGCILKTIEAKIKYLSLEPLLDFNKYAELFGINIRHILEEAGIKWVIIGAQTKPYKPPKIEWVEEIVRACDKAGVPVFLKDNLKPLIDSPADESYSLFVNDNQELRQEVPK